MKLFLKKIGVLFLLLGLPLAVMADERVDKVYEKKEVPRETVAISRFGRVLEDVEYILLEVGSRELEHGDYEVKVTKVEDHIYHIEETDLYIRMPYCYKYANRDRAILRIDSGYSSISGKLLWIED